MDLIIYNAIDDLEHGQNKGLSHMLQGLCDGMLLILPRISDTHLKLLEQNDLPVVLVNYSRGDTSLPIVRGDNRDGAAAATRHLLQLGHQRIAFIAGDLHTGQSQERQRGYEQAMRGAGIAIGPGLVEAGDFSRRSGYAAACTLLALASPPTAIFAANDEMAFGAMDAVRAAGLRMPQDVSVVGFDDISAAAQAQPGLSTVRQPLVAISEAAVRELLLRVTGSGGHQPLIEYPSELVLRGSTAAPPRAARARKAASPG
jgi:LacI family transcriptional regulator